MHILLTGGTGLIGRAYAQGLLNEGHLLTVLTRNAVRARALLGKSITTWPSLNEWSPELHFDIVVNLAGEPIIDQPWSKARREQLRASRIDLTRRLVDRMLSAEIPPALFISGSAIGYYGYHPCHTFDEDAPAGDGFAAQLCRDWEYEAMRPAQSGIRTCILRTGLVLSRSGGMLEKMSLPIRFGLATRMGSGAQWMSWIHMQDYLNILNWLREQPTASGAYNAVAPGAVTHEEFMAQLARRYHNRLTLTIPAWLLSAILGERSKLLSEGQRVYPKHLLEKGFRFSFSELGPALCALTQP